MGTECACLGQDAHKAQAVEKENQNSKFFYYSDPQILLAFQEKLTSIQKNISQQKRQREKKVDEGHWNYPSQLNCKPSNGNSASSASQQYHSLLGSTLASQTSQQVSQLRQLQSQISAESLKVMKNLELEKQSGWNEAIPQRLVLEIGQVQGLWNTSESWFTQCRSMVQVEYAGNCFNTKPSSNVKDPYFAELHIFPGAGGADSNYDHQEHASTKVFISILTVEGKTKVKEHLNTSDDNELLKEAKGPNRRDKNVYKRIAEYCLDIHDICEDQMVHDLVLTLPLKSKDPPGEPLFHMLRNCNISGLQNDLSGITDENNKQLMRCEEDYFALNPHQDSPPIKKELVRQKQDLAIYKSPQRENYTADKDISLLKIISEIDEPLRIRPNEQQRQRRRSSVEKKESHAVQTTRHNSQRNVLLGPTPRGSQSRPFKEFQSPSKQQSDSNNNFDQVDSLKVFEQNLHSMLPATKQRVKTMQKLRSEEGGDSVRSNAFSRAGNQLIGMTTRAQRGFDEDFSKQVTAFDDNVGGQHSTTASRGATMKVKSKLGPYFQSPDPKLSGGFGGVGRHALEPLEGNEMLTRRSTFYANTDHKSSRPRRDNRKLAIRQDSPPVAIKAMPWEDAVALPCRSFSFDDEFALDSENSVDDNWSPVAMGKAPVTIENRVSPCKPFKDTLSLAAASQNSGGLLGGVFPILKSRQSNRVMPVGADGVVASSTTGAAEMTAPQDGEVKISLRIQYLQNSTEYLLQYKQKLQQTSKAMKKLDMNREFE